MMARLVPVCLVGIRPEAGALRAAAEAIARATLGRIEKLNGGINAYTRIYAEDALSAARATDKAIATGQDPGPLAGATFGAKDLYDIAGRITTAGARLRDAAAPASEAPCVAPAGVRSATGRSRNVRWFPCFPEARTGPTPCS